MSSAAVGSLLDPVGRQPRARPPAAPGVSTPSRIRSTRFVPPPRKPRAGSSASSATASAASSGALVPERPHRGRPRGSPAHDVDVGAAAAEVAAHALADLGAGRARHAAIVRDGARPAGARPRQHAHRRADLARRAVAALERIVLDERLLQRMQLVARRPDPRSVTTSAPSCATASARQRCVAAAVDQHRAGTALAVVAALLRAGQPELLAQEVEQRRARVDRDVVRDAVHPQLHVGDDRGVHGFGHALSFPRRPTSNPHRVVPEMFTSIGPGHALSVRIRSPGRVRRTRWRLACPPRVRMAASRPPGYPISRSPHASPRLPRQARCARGQRPGSDHRGADRRDRAHHVVRPVWLGSASLRGARRLPRGGRHPRPRADGHRRGRWRRGRAHRAGRPRRGPVQHLLRPLLHVRARLHSQCETTQVREQNKGASLFGYTKLYGQVPGGQAELLRVPQAQFGPIKVPEGPPDERFVYLSDVLPTAWQGVEYADVPAGGTLVVFGLGPIGQMCAPHRPAPRSRPRDRRRPRPGAPRDGGPPRRRAARSRRASTTSPGRCAR